MKYEFHFYCKPTLTNVQIKPHSCILIASIFKKFLARTTKTCSRIYLRTEIEYQTYMFCESGVDRKSLQTILNENN